MSGGKSFTAPTIGRSRSSRVGPSESGVTISTRTLAPCMFHPSSHKSTTGGVGRVPLGRRSPTRSEDRPAGPAPSQPAQARGPTPDSQGRADRVPHPRRSPMTATFGGLDVSKDHLDLHVRPAGAAARFANDDAGIAALVARLAAAAPDRVVVEATGGYEAPAVAALAAAGLPVVVVN